MKYDDFLYMWSGIARAYTYHEAWRKSGYKVQLAERGVVIYRPKAVSYLDQI